jgi:hypothetical protein
MNSTGRVGSHAASAIGRWVTHSNKPTAPAFNNLFMDISSLLDLACADCGPGHACFGRQFQSGTSGAGPLLRWQYSATQATAQMTRKPTRAVFAVKLWWIAASYCRTFDIVCRAR